MIGEEKSVNYQSYQNYGGLIKVWENIDQIDRIKSKFLKKANINDKLSEIKYLKNKN